jgi:hypothetical protein
MADSTDVPELSTFATLDLDRAARRGYPEAIYCQHKTPEQVAAIAAIAATVRHRADVVTLFTRADQARAEGFVAYAGRYTLPWRPRRSSRGAVPVSQLVGSDQERFVELAEDRLALSASPRCWRAGTRSPDRSGSDSTEPDSGSPT